ncbi:hypothetical protein C8R45DRAFT_929060 [Mycena sanguinolenta]|nr:hypothetical protein C8R45DRAFT_929060 [Mycena sanguinolenta]
MTWLPKEVEMIIGRSSEQAARFGHGSTRGYPEGNPYPYPSIPYPANPRAANPYGSPAGVALPAVPQTRRVNLRYATAKRWVVAHAILFEVSAVIWEENGT